MKKSLYLIFNSLYLSGIVFIGAQVLLSALWETAFMLSVLTFFVYLVLVGLATFVVNKFFKANQSILAPFRKSILVASIVVIFVPPISVFFNWLVIAEMASAKYYFYVTMWAMISFATTMTYGLLVATSTEIKRKKGLEKLFTFLLELVKTTLWILVFVLLGTTYSQVLTGVLITSGEMFLIFYTLVGALVMFIVPILKSLVDVLDRIISYENSS